MSQSAAVRTARSPRPAARHHVRPSPLPGRAQQAPRLRAVSVPRHTRSRAGLVVVCLALLALGLVGLLLLDVGLERGTYELRDQNVRAEQLREQEQRLQRELQDRTAPQNLAAQARKLGMVDADGAPVFVLPNGRTIGVPQRAAAVSSPTVTAAPSGRMPAARTQLSGKPGGKAATAPATATSTSATTHPAATGSPAARPTPRH
jgi:hypothetical protein